MLGVAHACIPPRVFCMCAWNLNHARSTSEPPKQGSDEPVPRVVDSLGIVFWRAGVRSVRHSAGMAEYLHPAPDFV